MRSKGRRGHGQANAARACSGEGVGSKGSEGVSRMACKRAIGTKQYIYEVIRIEEIYSVSAELA